MTALITSLEAAEHDYHACADYLIEVYERLQQRKVVRDLAEARACYVQAKAAVAALRAVEAG